MRTLRGFTLVELLITLAVTSIALAAAVVAANAQERAQILDAVFDLSREEVVKRVQAGKMAKVALEANDYIYDIFPATKNASAQQLSAD